MSARTLRQALLLLALAALPALVSGAMQLQTHREEPLAPGEVRVATAQLWREHVQWVDARPQARFDAGHIPGAILLNEEQWETLLPKFLDAWDPDKTVIVYCDGGHCDASRAVAERLRGELQIQSTFVLKGGWPAWQAR